MKLVINGEYLGVGSPEYSLSDSLQETGAAYVFQPSVSLTQNTHFLQADTPEAHMRFGKEMATSGDQFLIGTLNTSGIGSATFVRMTYGN